MCVGVYKSLVNTISQEAWAALGFNSTDGCGPEQKNGLSKVHFHYVGS